MIIFGLNNRIDSATLTSTATFATTLPLANIQTPYLPQFARTDGDMDFTITVNLSGLPARNMGVVAIVNHNLSRTAVVSVELIQNSGSVAASGDLSPWPYLSPADPHFPVHNYSAGIIDTDRMALSMPMLTWFSDVNKVANKVVITISDPANAAGYVQIGRLFVGSQLEPQIGEDWGDAAWSYVDPSDITKSKSGVKFAFDRPRRRSAAIAFKQLTNTEAEGALLAAQRDSGLVGEIIIAPSRPDWLAVGDVLAVDSFWHSQAFLGNFAELDKITRPYLAAYAMTISLEEVAR